MDSTWTASRRACYGRPGWRCRCRCRRRRWRRRRCQARTLGVDGGAQQRRGAGPRTHAASASRWPRRCTARFGRAGGSWRPRVRTARWAGGGPSRHRDRRLGRCDAVAALATAVAVGRCGAWLVARLVTERVARANGAGSHPLWRDASCCCRDGCSGRQHTRWTQGGAWSRWSWRLRWHLGQRDAIYWPKCAPLSVPSCAAVTGPKCAPVPCTVQRWRRWLCGRQRWWCSWWWWCP